MIPKDKNTFLIGFLVCLLAIVGSSVAFANDDPITLTVSVWSNNPNPGIVEQAKMFEERNPGIKVEVYYAPNAEYVDKIFNLVATGQAPDVIKVDGYYFPMFVEAGVLRPLDDFAERDKEFMDGFFPHTFMPDHQIYDGVLYGIPNGDSARAMYFNIDMFQVAGLPLPTELAETGGWDWDTYVESVRKLTRTVDGEVVQWGTQVSSDIRVLINWIRMNGGSLLNADKTAATLTTPETLGAIEFQRSLYQDYGVAKPGLGTNQFVSGELATMINGIWAAQSLTDVAFEWDAGPLPEGVDGLWSMYKPNSFSMSRSTKHPEEAWELIKFLTGDEIEALSIPDGSHEVKRKANARLLLELHPIPNVRYFLDMIANGRVFSLPVVPSWSEVENAFNREWRDVRDGKQDPLSGMIRAEEAINAILNR